MKKHSGWLLIPMIAFLLSSCGGDMMQVMVEDKQPVGVLVVKQSKPVANAGHVQVINGVYSSASDPVEGSIAARVSSYDHHNRTAKDFGKRVVAKLRSQGIDAHLLDCFPAQEGLVKNRAAFGHVINYPAERKRYPRYLAIDGYTGAGVDGKSSGGVSIVPLVSVNGWLFDSATDRPLGSGGSFKVGSWHPANSQVQVNSAFDSVLGQAREEMLNETFYVYEE